MSMTNHHRRSANPERCAADVFDGWHLSQCRSKRHPDTLDGAFCKTHCPERKKAKREKRDAARRAKSAERQAYYEKKARQEKLKDEAVSLIKGFAAFGTGAVGEASKKWLAKWKATE